MVLEVAMDLIQPTIMQHIIDVGIANRDLNYVIKMGLLMIGAAALGLVGGLGCMMYSTKAAVNFATDIRKDVFAKIETFSSNNRDSFGTGKLLTIVTNDITSIQSAMTMTLRVLVRGAVIYRKYNYCFCNSKRVISNITCSCSDFITCDYFNCK